MSNQFLKLRRSAVPGKVPETSSLEYGEIALNTYDGLAFMKKSGSSGEEVVTIGSTAGAFTGSFSGSFTGSLQGTASWAYNALTASTADNFLVRQNITASNALIQGTITAQTLVVQTISSSIIYSSGSNKFGDELTDTQQFTGSVTITGSLNSPIITGSLFGTASWATNFLTSSVTSASYALTASYLEGYISPFPFTGSAQITGSLGVTGSVSISGSQGDLFTANIDTLLLTGSLITTGSMQLTGSMNVLGSITSSLFGTASWAQNFLTSSVTSASYALTASYVNPLNQQVIITGSLIQGIEGNIASGTGSHAEGYFTIASESYSHAEGAGTQAIGFASHAEGAGTQATGIASHAEGNNTTSSGDYSHAEGADTTTLELYSHAEGTGSIASGIASHAEGYITLASGSYSHAEGDNTQAIGIGSHAEGTQLVGEGTTPLIAYGDYSHAEGGGTLASGSLSHAEGEATIARGYASHTEGQSTETLEGASYAHAEGVGSIAAGPGSHAEGYYTIASGSYSHAEGFSTETYGQASHAGGFGTVALGNYQYVVGSLNISSSDQSAFIIGNGVQNQYRSNLVFASGSQFQITGSTLITGSLTSIGNLIVTGSIDATGDITAFATSDIRFKENIKPIANAIDKINQIGGYTFTWNDDKDLASIHGHTGIDVGVMAQEIELVLPEVVTTRDSGYKAVRYEKIVPLLIQAIKEQQKEINELRETIKNKL
jgi:hypothetical protein